MATPELLEEIKLLNQFDLDSVAIGIKVHAQQAPEESVAAAKRLFDKGMTDQSDGGYLTERGIEAAKHAKRLINLLTV